MIDPETALSLVAAHGLGLVAPLALIEGPIITVIAAWLAQQQVLDLWAVMVTVVLADLAGDALLYLAGRSGGRRVLGLLRLDDARVDDLALKLRRHAGRLIVGGKLTHAAGAAVLFASGTARVPFGFFMLMNLVATVPKSLVFVALGWWAGASYDRIGLWLLPCSLALAAFVLAVLVLRRRTP